MAVENKTQPAVIKGARNVEVDDLYRFRLVSEPQVSPDGRHVAYVLTRLRKKKNDYASNIWLVPVEGSGEPVKFTGSAKRDMSPQWSPQGDQIAFISTRSGKPQIWIIRAGGGEARQLTRLKRGAGEIEWSPDGRWIAFTATVDNELDKKLAAERKDKAEGEEGSGDENREPGAVSEEGFIVPPREAGDWDEDEDGEDEESHEDKGDHAKVFTRLRIKADGQGLLERRQHVFIVPSKGGAPKQVTDGDWDARLPRWSPDGRHLAFLADQEPDADYNAIADVFVVPVGDDGTVCEQRRVTHHDCAITGMDWLPSGDGFAIFAHRRIHEGALGTNLELWTLSLERGETRSLTAALDRSCGSWVNSDLRSGGGGLRPQFSKDGSTIYFLVTNGGAVQVFSVPAAGGDVKQVLGGERQIYDFDVGPNGLAFAATTPVLPNDLFACDLAGGNERRLTEVNRDVLGELRMSEPQEIWIDRPDGGRVEGWTLMPPDFREGERYPMVLEIHGGPHTAYGAAYFHELQVLAARGYIVLYTNPRGSQGYGQQFADAILGDWGGLDYDDLMACVDSVIGQGHVDEERLGVAGGSYGGYMTAWVIGHTQRFKAAVAMRPVTNVYSAWGSGDGTWMLWNWEFEGTPQERAAFYLERSPITYVSEMHTPLLITHAEDDLRVNIEQADELYTALKLLKREVKLVRFPAGGHEVSRTGKPSLRVERLEHIVEWFETHLRGDP